jgi:hypothetical protein
VWIIGEGDTRQRRESAIQELHLNTSQSILGLRELKKLKMNRGFRAKHITAAWLLEA